MTSLRNKNVEVLGKDHEGPDGKNSQKIFHRGILKNRKASGITKNEGKKSEKI